MARFTEKKIMLATLSTNIKDVSTSMTKPFTSNFLQKWFTSLLSFVLVSVDKSLYKEKLEIEALSINNSAKKN